MDPLCVFPAVILFFVLRTLVRPPRLLSGDQASYFLLPLDDLYSDTSIPYHQSDRHLTFKEETIIRPKF